MVTAGGGHRGRLAAGIDACPRGVILCTSRVMSGGGNAAIRKLSSSCCACASAWDCASACSRARTVRRAGYEASSSCDCDEAARGEAAGDVGETSGGDGEYVGDPGEYVGDAGEYMGDGGEYEGTNPAPRSPYGCWRPLAWEASRSWPAPVSRSKVRVLLGSGTEFAPCGWRRCGVCCGG